MYIAIAGNIGSGKTSLAEILADRLGARLLEESIDNPYLNDFYEDMGRWSFNLQISFLGSRIRQAYDSLGMAGDLVQDRTVYEDAYIFADNLHEMGLLPTRDFDAYMKIFDLVRDHIPRPDILIYLKASVPTLVSQIHRRGRAYEMSIQEEYLARLNEKYEHWINDIYEGQVVTIDMDQEDFLLDPSVVDRLLAVINDKLLMIND
jgi:deoxyadenosine/deoxycytidine kinase